MSNPSPFTPGVWVLQRAGNGELKIVAGADHALVAQFKSPTVSVADALLMSSAAELCHLAREVSQMGAHRADQMTTFALKYEVESMASYARRLLRRLDDALKVMEASP